MSSSLQDPPTPGRVREKLAVVLRGPGPRIAALAPAARRCCVTLAASELEGLDALEPSSLVLLAGGLDRPEHRARVEAWRHRYRERGWYEVVPRGARALAREGLTEAALRGPVDLTTLRALSEAHHELRCSRRGEARAASRIGALEHRLVLLSDTIQAAGSLLDPRMVARFIMERAAGLIGTSRWRLYRVDESAGLLRLDTWPGEKGPSPADELPLDQGIAGCTARSRRVGCFEPELDAHVPDWTAEWPGDRPRLLLGVPLVSRGRVIGVAEFADPSGGRIMPMDLETIAALMEPAAIALDNAQLFRKLEERTVTDDLTQLYNARFMDNYLRRETKRAARYGHPVALLFLDLDGFKTVNDTHGHMAGSRTLVEVGQVLKRNIREIDIAARWGGDEFAVVLPETERDGAEVMADRLCRRIREQVFLRDLGLEVRISASIGVASWPENGPSAATLLAAADAAMYYVKNAGKDGIRMAPAASHGDLVGV